MITFVFPGNQKYFLGSGRLGLRLSYESAHVRYTRYGARLIMAT